MKDTDKSKIHENGFLIILDIVASEFLKLHPNALVSLPCLFIEQIKNSIYIYVCMYIYMYIHTHIKEKWRYSTSSSLKDSHC